MDNSKRELEFLGTLGQGGFGAVYLANLRSRDGFVRRVAVKVMREGLEHQPQLLARQRDEARLLGLLANEQIVQVLELTVVQGRPAVVMEYVEGVDVAELLRAVAEHRLPPRPALEIVAATASALDAAWNTIDPRSGAPLHVVHRDIKPANLFITSSGGVKVLDFGIAKADFEREGNTTSGSFGTPRFMAPEQWLQDPYGGPVDIYALGVSLYEMTSGRAWERPVLSVEGFAKQVRHALATIPDLDPDVGSLIERMTAFDPAERPTPAEVHLQAISLAEQMRDKSLSIYARKCVPPLVAERRSRLAAESLPASVSLVDVPLDGATFASVSAGRTGSAIPGSVKLTGGLLAVAVLMMGVIGAPMMAIWGYQRLSRGVAAEPPEAAPAEAALEAVITPPPLDVPVVEALLAEAPLPDAAAPPIVASTATPPTIGRPRTAQPRSAPGTAATTGIPAADPAPSAPLEAAPLASPPLAPPPLASPPAAAPPEVAAIPFQLTSEPIGAELWVDGRACGRTPNRSLVLTHGSHEVVIEMDGQRAERTIEIGAASPAGLRYYFSDKTWKSVR